MARTYPTDRTLSATTNDIDRVIIGDLVAKVDDSTGGFITNVAPNAVLKVQASMSAKQAETYIYYSPDDGANWVELKRVISGSSHTHTFNGTIALPLSASQEWAALKLRALARTTGVLISLAGGYGAVSVTDWYIDSPINFSTRQIIEAV